MNERKAEPGEELSAYWPGERVLDRCEDKEAPGYWLCLPHEMAFPNNIMLEGHVEKSDDHVVAWLCQVHGIETP